jgi:hypothetical protein
VNALPSVPISGVGHNPVQHLHEGSTMSYSANVQTGAPLGVGAIVSESFSILLKHFVSVILLALIPTLIGFAISGLLTGWDVALGLSAPAYASVGDVIPSILSTIAQMVAYGLSTALLVQMAYDSKLGRPLQLGRYVNPALSAAVPIAVLSIASGLLVALGLIALIIPGLWIYAVFSMMPAAVVIERVGFSGLGRSAALTKEYRWPILGATFLILLINIVIGLVTGFIVGLILAGVGGGFVGIVVGVLLFSVINSIGTGLGSIAVALIYARLREIKEGTSVRDIAAVFD